MKTQDDSLKIGELSSMFGLTARTIRYYEELGLLKSNDRTEGIHRRYPGVNIIYLKRIQQLKGYGLSLGEIKEFFDLAERDPSGESCRDLLLTTYQKRIALEEKKILESRTKILELQERATVLQRLESFFFCPGEECPGCPGGGLCGESRGTGIPGTGR
ncbi:MAG TPA: MerR family transcriptional regulator [Spirochaetales bacterium]|jgi:DNA-binding transcriptional MerR regulator|nr:MerR family transcriptional regulator [Spirochaetales bacterium]